MKSIHLSGAESREQAAMVSVSQPSLAELDEEWSSLPQDEQDRLYEQFVEECLDGPEEPNGRFSMCLMRRFVTNRRYVC